MRIGILGAAAVGSLFTYSATATATPAVKPDQALVYGGDKEDAMNSMVVDAQGNAYLTGVCRGLPDRFNYDICATKVGADGKFLWSRTFGGEGEDGINNYIDSAGEGPSRMATLDDAGNLYIAARSAGWGKKAGFASTLLKVKPDGTLAWSRLWRPHWKDQANGMAMATSVSVVGNRAYVVGMTGGAETSEEGQIMVSVYDTESGKMLQSQSLDPSPGMNDRAWAVTADKARGALWIAGWEGSKNRGILTRMKIEGDKVTHDWTKRIPLPQIGSTICDLDLDAEGNVYLAGDVHGAGTSMDILKVTPAGEPTWITRYNAAVPAATTNNVHVVRVIGDKLYVGGRVGYNGSKTNADPVFGDSLLMTLDKGTGKVTKELYYFTGTGSTLSIDRVRGIAKVGDKLLVGGSVWPKDINVAGEWRDPNTNQVQHAFETLDPKAYVFTTATVKVKDLSTEPAKDGATFPSLAWTDVTAQFTSGTPEKMSDKGRSTQFYLFGFKGL